MVCAERFFLCTLQPACAFFIRIIFSKYIAKDFSGENSWVSQSITEGNHLKSQSWMQSHVENTSRNFNIVRINNWYDPPPPPPPHTEVKKLISILLFFLSSHSYPHTSLQLLFLNLFKHLGNKCKKTLTYNMIHYILYTLDDLIWYTPSNLPLGPNEKKYVAFRYKS